MFKIQTNEILNTVNRKVIYASEQGLKAIFRYDNKAQILYVKIRFPDSRVTVDKIAIQYPVNENELNNQGLNINYPVDLEDYVSSFYELPEINEVLSNWIKPGGILDIIENDKKFNTKTTELSHSIYNSLSKQDKEKSSPEDIDEQLSSFYFKTLTEFEEFKGMINVNVNQ